MAKFLFWFLLAANAAVVIAAMAALAPDLERIGFLRHLGPILFGVCLLAAGALAALAVWYRETGSPLAIVAVALPALGGGAWYAGGRIDDWRQASYGNGNHEFGRGPMRRLANAVAEADVAAVRAAIPDSGNLNVRGTHGMTILVFAAQSRKSYAGGLEILKAILEAGADPNYPCQDGVLPLEVAAGPEYVQELLARGADPNAKGREPG